MLEQISIQNLGIIEAAELTFSPRLTVLTGETGAGKTMVLTSIAMLLGKKIDSAIVRSGAQQCEVEGTFFTGADSAAVQRLQLAGGESDEGEVLISRIVKAQGRSKAFAGGRAVPASVLGQIGESLITIHGQSEQVKLKDSAYQMEVLDSFGSDAYTQQLQQLADVVAQINSLKKQLVKWQESERYRNFEIQELQEALQLYEKVSPKPGEYDELRARMERLGNVEELREAVVNACNSVNGEYSESNAVSLLSQAVRELEKSSAADEKLGEWAEALSEARTLIEETARDLQSYASDLQDDPKELARTHDRIALFKKGAKRAGCSVDEWTQWAEQAQQKLDELSGPQNLGDKLTAQLETLGVTADELAGCISKQRAQLALELAEKINLELQGLSMGANVFEISLTPCTLGPKGQEKVNFGLRSPGQAARSLGQAVSGGELSRIMLAIEVAVAQKHAGADSPAIIFDEIDSGIGGETALAVGARLARLALTHQVIVVTHLPQVAAWADKHLVVRKENNVTSVVEVQAEQRANEISRMLSGISDSQHAHAHAKELIAGCKVE